MPGSRASTPGKVSTTVVLLLMLSSTLLAAGLPAGAQTGDSSEGNPLTVQVSADSFGPGEDVRYQIVNEADEPVAGNLSHTFIRSTDAGPERVFQRGPAYETFQAGQVREGIWPQVTDVGEQAPRGTYWILLTWHDGPYADEPTRSSTFQLRASSDDPGSDTQPDVRVLSPLDGQRFLTGDVPVRVHAESDAGLTWVNVTLDGEGVISRHAEGARQLNITETIEVAPGSHELLAGALDLDTNYTKRAVSFFVDDGAGPVPSLTVSATPRFVDPDGRAELTVVNEANRTLEGDLAITVTNRSEVEVFTHVQPDVALEPGASSTVRWDLVRDDGTRASPGRYVVRAELGDAFGQGFLAIEPQAPEPIPPPRPEPSEPLRLSVLAPEPGSAHDDEVRFEIRVEGGATRVELEVVDGQTTFEASKRFDPPLDGRFNHTLDLSDAPSGAYRALITATSSNATAHAATWFRVQPGEDTTAPGLELVHPEEGDTVPRLFPAVFQAEDDVGIRYAEVYLDGELVGRESWSHPVLVSAFPVRLPADTQGPSDLRLVVYDAGRNEASATISVDIQPAPAPCELLIDRAREALTAVRSGVEASADQRPTLGNVSERPALECPASGAADRPAVDRGRFQYSVSDEGQVRTVRVDGRPVIDAVDAEDADGAQRVRVEARGEVLVFEGERADTVHYDFNGSWVATQRGPHVLLEDPATGERVLVAVVGGEPELLGKRLVAQLGERGHVVARPVGEGATEDALVDAIVDGLVGAEVHVRGQADSETVSYGELNLSVSTSEQRIAASVSSDQHSGRTVVFNVADGVDVSQGVDVTIDGEPIEQASSLADVLNPHDDGEASEYFIVQADGETKVIVSFGHFSTRQLVIQAADAVERFLTPLAIGGAVLVVSLATYALFRRPEA